MAANPVVATGIGVNRSAEHAFAITKADGSDIANTTRALWVGGAGDVAVVMVGGETVTFTSVPAGTMLPISVTRVLSTGTSATNILGIY